MGGGWITSDGDAVFETSAPNGTYPSGVESLWTPSGRLAGI